MVSHLNTYFDWLERSVYNIESADFIKIGQMRDIESITFFNIDTYHSLPRKNIPRIAHRDIDDDLCNVLRYLLPGYFLKS